MSVEVQFRIKPEKRGKLTALEYHPRHDWHFEWSRFRKVASRAAARKLIAWVRARDRRMAMRANRVLGRPHICPIFDYRVK